MIVKSLVLVVLAALPLLATLQNAPLNETKKDAPPKPAVPPISASSNFTHDGKPLQLGEKVELFNGKDTTGWKAFVPDLAKDSKDPLSVWSVKDGVLQCAGRPIGDIQIDALYDYYVLVL